MNGFVVRYDQQPGLWMDKRTGRKMSVLLIFRISNRSNKISNGKVGIVEAIFANSQRRVGIADTTSAFQHSSPKGGIADYSGSNGLMSPSNLSPHSVGRHQNARNRAGCKGQTPALRPPVSNASLRYLASRQLA
jgi:hypothetical protein